MANSVKEKLVVTKLTQFGIQVGSNRYSYSKFCDKNVTLKEGDTIEADVYTGPKGGMYLNGYTVLSTSNQPALPPTTVSATPAPKGEVPVAPAKRRADEALELAKKQIGDSEKMTKADWNAKDIAIERVAIVKSVIESGAYAQLSVGKRLEDVLAIGEAMIDFFLKKLNSLK